MALGVLLGALVAAAYLGVGYYYQAKWFVTQVDGQVAMFQGRPGGLLWLEPERVPLDGPNVDTLIPQDKERVAEDRPQEFDSKAEATAFVDSLMLAEEIVKDPAAQLGGVEASTSTVPGDPNAVTTTVPVGGLVTVPGAAGAAGGAEPASPASTATAATAASAGSSTSSAG